MQNLPEENARTTLPSEDFGFRQDEEGQYTAMSIRLQPRGCGEGESSDRPFIY